MFSAWRRAKKFGGHETMHSKLPAAAGGERERNVDVAFGLLKSANQVTSDGADMPVRADLVARRRLNTTPLNIWPGKTVAYHTEKAWRRWVALRSLRHDRNAAEKAPRQPMPPRRIGKETPHRRGCGQAVQGRPHRETPGGKGTGRLAVRSQSYQWLASFSTFTRPYRLQAEHARHALHLSRES